MTTLRKEVGLHQLEHRAIMTSLKRLTRRQTSARPEFVRIDGSTVQQHSLTPPTRAIKAGAASTAAPTSGYCSSQKI